MEKRRAYHGGYYRLTLRHGPFRPKRLRARRRAADVRIPFTAQDFARKRDRIIETAEILLELRQRMMVSNARRAGAAVIRSRRRGKHTLLEIDGERCGPIYPDSQVPVCDF